MKFWYLHSTKKKRPNIDLMMKAAEKLGVTVEKHNIEIEQIRSGDPHVVGELIQEMEANHVDAVICRGSTEKWLRSAGMDWRIPIIPVQFLASSTFSLIADVKKNHPEEFEGKDIKAVVFSHKALILNYELIRYLFGLKLRCKIIEDDRPDRLRAALRQTMEEGADFILAGSNVCEIAQEMGIHAYYNKDADEYETLYRTLEQAIVFAENVRTQQDYQRALEYMMDYSFEGMLRLNADGIVTFCNSAVSQIVGLDKKELMGRGIWELVPELDEKKMSGVLKAGGNIYGYVIRVREYVVIVNAIPYVQGGEIRGAILHMTQKERIESLETQIKNEIYVRGLTAKYHFSNIMGESEEIEECIYKARQFARHRANVLILGESGTGKELFAQSIHNESMRREQPFVAVNCGALPVSLLESELFGYVGGAFTGASRQGKKGLIELADKGTIFLDEISEMDPQGQVRLLRVLEERVITKVGDDRVIPVDVRIIAASNKNLLKLVKEGRFREDLYYRLNVLTLRIPPLRERGEDILLLARYFLNRYGNETLKELELTEEAGRLLLSCPWHGNVRQLRNFCERMAIISDSRKVSAEMIRRQLEEIDEDFAVQSAESRTQAAAALLQNAKLEENPAGTGAARDTENRAPGQALSAKELKERARLTEALRACKGNRTEAAEILGMGRSSLWRKMKKYRITGSWQAEGSTVGPD